MYTLRSTLVATLVLGLIPFLASAFFSRDLSLGAEGQDVLELQQLLNTRTETRVAESGPGSLGKETIYYGTLTANAVKKYQELFSQEILSPVNLTTGTGFFGPTTRQFANNVGGGKNAATGMRVIAEKQTNAFLPPLSESFGIDEDPHAQEKEILRDVVSRMPPTVISSTEMQEAASDKHVVPASNVAPTTTRAVANLEQAQNEDNVDMLITFLDEGGYLDDMDASLKKSVKDQIRKNAKEGLVVAGHQPTGLTWRIPESFPKESPLSKFVQSSVGLFSPQKAEAVFYPIFGGLIYYRFFCTASFNWAVLIGLPLPAWIGYNYTQAYAYWQFPFALWAKGWYTPGVQTCWIYVGTGAVPIPTMGVATFMIGTSLP